jgi:hypothetical protein
MHGHQADVCEHLKVLGRLRLAQSESVGDLAHRTWVSGEQLDDLKAIRLRQRG